MALSKIQRNMLAAGSVLPENLVTTSTFTVNGLRTTLGVTATSVTATSSNITTMAGGSLALTGNASAVHVNASGNVGATAVRATTVTATNAIVTNGNVTNLTATNLTVGNLTVQNTIPTLTFTTATGYRLVLSGAGSQVQSEIATIADLYVSNAYHVNGVNGLVVRNLRSSTSTSVLFFNTVTNEATYGLLSELIPGAFDQDLNTTNVVRFAGVTATSITVGAGNLRFPDATQQSTAWTGTVANSQITSVSTTKVNGLSTIGYTGKLSDATGSISTSSVTGLSTVGYTNQYADLTGKPALATVATSGSYNDLADKPTNQSLFTNSNVTFNRVDATTSSVTTSTVGTLRFADGTAQTTAVIANQTLNTNSTVTFRTINIPFDTTGGGNIVVGGAVVTMDINSPATYLYLDALEGIVNEVDFKLQHDIEPFYNPANTQVSNVNIGNPGRLIRNVYAGYGSFTGTVFTKDLIPNSGQDTWSTAGGQIGSSDHRWGEIWVKDIYSSSDIVGGTLTADQIRFNNDPAGRYQTTAWTGTVAASAVTGLSTVATSGNYLDLSNKPYTPNQNVDSTSSPTFANLTVLGTMTTLNVTTENVTTENIVTQNFSDGTSQTTAWTGTVANSQITSVSTTKVNGLSVVGYTNNYNDLTNIPQALGTTASPTFAGLTLTTGTNVNRTVSAGGFPLNSAGTATIFTASGQSPSLVVSNYTSGLVPNIYVRGYGQNRPGGTASTAPNSNITIEGSRGTAASPTTIVAGDNLGGMTVGGYDGNNWQSDFSKAPNFFGWYATENWGFDSVTTTSTIRAGSGFNLFVQPAWTQTGINQTRQRMIFTSWTTSTTAPSQINIIMGSGVDGATGTSTHVLANGNSYVGPGRANMTYINPLTNFLGVPATDPAPENSTLTATNVINLVSNRRSGTSGRRNPILAGDSLYTLNFRGQHQPNATGVGLIGSAITTTALDNFTSTQYGTSMAISTVNTGTAVTRNRLFLTDRLMQLSADQFQFNNGGYANIPLTFTTSTWNSSIDTYTFGNTAGTVNMLQMTANTAAFAPGVAITTYNRTYGEFCYTGASITATATNTIYAFPLNTTNTASGVVIQSGQQIKFNQVGGAAFKIIMSLQTSQTANAVAGMDFWLRKNGVDVPNSATQVDLLKDQKAVVAMDWLVTPAVNDYYEIVYAVDDTNLEFPFYAAQASPFIRPAIPPIIVNVIPVGA